MLYEWVYSSFFEYMNGYGFNAEEIYEWGYFSNSSGTTVPNFTLTCRFS